MTTTTTPMTTMPARKRIALVAHDAEKAALAAWAKTHAPLLERHELWATGTTGARIIEATGLPVTRLKSGPLGGDLQLGAMIADDALDMLIFFIDPLAALPHDVDVKALLRISALRQIAVATNRATADFLAASSLLAADYDKAPSGRTV